MNGSILCPLLQIIPLGFLSVDSLSLSWVGSMEEPGEALSESRRDEAAGGEDVQGLHHALPHHLPEGLANALKNQIPSVLVVVVRQQEQELHQRLGQPHVLRHGVDHQQDRRLDVHDAVVGLVEEEPVVEERQLRAGGEVVLPAGREQPPHHHPPRHHVGAEHLVGRVVRAADEPHEVYRRRLLLRAAEEPPGEPLQVPPPAPRLHMAQQEPHLRLHLRRDPHQEVLRRRAAPVEPGDVGGAEQQVFPQAAEFRDGDEVLEEPHEVPADGGAEVELLPEGPDAEADLGALQGVHPAVAGGEPVVVGEQPEEDEEGGGEDGGLLQEPAPPEREDPQELLREPEIGSGEVPDLDPPEEGDDQAVDPDGGGGDELGGGGEEVGPRGGEEPGEAVEGEAEEGAGEEGVPVGDDGVEVDEVGAGGAGGIGEGAAGEGED